MRREGIVRNKGRVLFIGLALALTALLAGCDVLDQGITPAPEASATPGIAADVDGSEWILATLRGAELRPGTNITLGFADGVASGFAGCNAYGGPYSMGAGGALSVSTLEVTAQDCQDPEGVMEQEGVYLAALQDAAAYQVAGDRLDLVDAGGASLLGFARKEEFAMDPGDLPRTVWQLFTLNGASPVEGSIIILAFHDDRHASGHAGCREYTITYEASGDKIRFPFLSMRGDDACLADEALYEQEGQYTDALSWATNYLLREGRLEIRTARGEVLVFEPLSVGPAVRAEHAGPDFPPTDYGCTSPVSMVWSSHRLEGLSQQVQGALDAAGIEGSEVTAEAYGEDWFEQDGAGGPLTLCNFSIMETDFDLRLQADSLADLDDLGALLTRALAVLDRFPPEDTPGQQPGQVSVAFVSRGGEETRIWFSVTEGVQAWEKGLEGGALLEALRDRQDASLATEPEADEAFQAPASEQDDCEPYLDLAISFEDGEGQAAVTSYQCGDAHVDSTGQSPGSMPVPVPANSSLRLRFGAEMQPERVEARIYPGAGVSAYFFRWPEDLPTGVEPVAKFERLADPEYEIAPKIPTGAYSMVIRATWQGDAEVFYALGFSLE